jgi:hypothetical protein
MSNTTAATTNLSKSAALRQAFGESSMYRQGSGWIVSTWDPSVRLNRLTGELPFHDAQRRLFHWRVARARALQGLSDEGEE